jgi:hypothetical protein
MPPILAKTVIRNSGNCVVGPGGVPPLCNPKDLACPADAKAPTARKTLFPELSNLNPNPADAVNVDGLIF